MAVKKSPLIFYLGISSMRRVYLYFYYFLLILGTIAAGVLISTGLLRYSLDTGISIQAEEHNARILINVSKSTRLFDEECVTFSWELQSINAVYFNAEGVTGIDSREICSNLTREQVFQVHFQDGSQKEYRLLINEAISYSTLLITLIPHLLGLAFLIGRMLVQEIILPEYMTNLVHRFWANLRWILLIVSIISYFIHVYLSTTINHDELFQLGVSISLSQGYNQSLPLYDVQDLAQGERTNTIRTPLGYALVQILGGGDFHNNILIDAFMDGLSGLVFLVSWFYLIEVLGKTIKILPRLLIFLAQIIFPSALLASSVSGHSTGIVSVAFFSAAVALVAVIIANDYIRQNLLKASILAMLAGLCYSVTILMHYSYWPLIPVVPLALLIQGFFSSGFKLWRQYFITVTAFSLIAGTVLVLLAVNNFFLVGHFVRENPAPSSEISMDHLRYIIPFPAYVLGVNDASFWQAIAPLKFNYAFFVSIFILLASAYSLVYHFSAKTSEIHSQNSREAEILRYILLTSLISFILVVSYLAFITINSSIHPVRGGWLPIAELRYYSPIFPFLLFTFILTISTKSSHAYRNLHYMIVGLTVGIFIITGIPNLFTKLSEIGSFFSMQRNWDYPMVDILTELDANTAENDIVLFQPPIQLGVRELALAIGMTVATVWEETGFSSSEPIIIIFFADNENANWYFDHIQGNLLAQIPYRNGYFYQYELLGENNGSE